MHSDLVPSVENSAATPVMNSALTTKARIGEMVFGLALCALKESESTLRTDGHHYIPCKEFNFLLASRVKLNKAVAKLVLKALEQQGEVRFTSSRGFRLCGTGERGTGENAEVTYA